MTPDEMRQHRTALNAWIDHRDKECRSCCTYGAPERCPTDGQELFDAAFKDAA